jgi:type IV secretory pathway VirJ component
MTDTPSFDEIPVLTEVVAKKAPAAGPLDAPAAEPEAAPEAAAAAAAPDAAPDVADDAEAIPVLEVAAQAPPAPAQSAASGDDAWRALEERLVTRVLDRLQPRIDVVLEDQVRDQMAIVLDHVAERLGLELRSALQQSIEHVVARAVQQELAHLIARQG